MKAIKSILALAMVAILMGLGACSKATPAEQFAEALNKLSSQVASVKTPEEYAKIQEGIQAADKIITENADYQLTDNDRTVLKEAMKNFFTATLNKVGELQNQEIPEAQVDFMVNMVTAPVNNAKTLGELNKPMQGGTLIDDNNDAKPDSDIVEDAIETAGVVED